LGLEAQLEEEVEPADGLSDAEIEEMIQQRTDARKRKDFEMSDRIRNELASIGITLIDQPGGVTRWHRN
jgi:cysteinyl-tRNA synthetase